MTTAVTPYAGPEDAVAASPAICCPEGGRLLRVPFDDAQARETGLLRGLPVMTTDRAWRSLRLSIKAEVIR